MQSMNIKTPINATQPVKPLAGGGDHIFFSVGDSLVGKILVARTIVGVCAVLIGASGERSRGALSWPDVGRERIEGAGGS